MIQNSEKGYFFKLTPDRVLEAVESAHLMCTGRCTALNSLENRVYDIELEASLTEETLDQKPHPSKNHRIIKFYRPERWSKEQILEEHEFLENLAMAEIPVISPLQFPNGSTLSVTSDGPGSNIWYALFPKVGGRSPDEFSDDQLRRVGRLLARIHNVGAQKKSSFRLNLDVDTYAVKPLEFLLKSQSIPIEFQDRYQRTVEKLCEAIRPQLDTSSFQRIHGDCHLGNLLWNDQGPFFLDFDDMVFGPPIQDIWMLVPGRDADAVRQRNVLIEGYEEMRDFDRRTLKWIEPLRCLRIIHYSGWIARRWEDPAFPRAFPQFPSHSYWNQELLGLEEQLHLITKD